MLPKYKILTRKSILDIPYENADQFEKECRLFVAEQDKILMEKDFSLDKDYYIHIFESCFSDDDFIDEDINEAIQWLAIKDGYDLVQYENGNYGFVAYYNGTENGFEILRESEVD